MMFRNGWRVGDWLVQDEESGKVTYASKTKYDWKGLVVTQRYADYEQPQDFVRPSNDPRPAPFMSRQPDKLTVSTSTPTLVGNTSNPMSTRNAAYHLFTPDD